MNEVDKKLIVDRILASAKYRTIYRPTVMRIVDELAGRYLAKDLEKAVRNKMHQVWGAFARRANLEKLGQTVSNCIKLNQTETNCIKLGKTGKNLEKLNKTESDFVKMRSCVLPILKLQTSTDERINILDDYYNKIFEITGKPKVVFEPACGLNALTYFWMGEGVKYIGYDVDLRQIDFINQIFAECGVEKNAQVMLGDIFEEKYIEADVTMFLKVLILLERQKRGSSLNVLQKCKSKYIVISFPTRSISGKKKGMREYYKKYFQNLVAGQNWEVKVIDFENEVVFVVSKK